MRRQVSRSKSLLASLFLVGCTFAGYAPAARNGFIWDDDSYVTKNPTLTEQGGLSRIWLDMRASPQYYPLTFSLLYLEARLWGFNPTGFHLVSILLHACNAVLVWFVLRRLAVPGSYLAAALFALHPVEVESVAWVAEQKNALSGLLSLAALWCYLRFQPLEGQGTTEVSGRFRWWWYGLSLGLFVLALLAKSVVATLPGVLLLLLWWKQRRLNLRDLLSLVPFFVLGAAVGLNTARLEVIHVGAHGPDFERTSLDRLLVACRAICFYAAKLIAPTELTFFYPRWHVDPDEALQWLSVLAVSLTLVVLFVLRRRLGKGPLTAVLSFCVILFPGLGFVNVYPMRYSFVADHFQYHASIALLALFAAVAARAIPGLQDRRLVATAAALPIVVVLGLLTWSRCLVYRDSMTLWTDTLAKNPNAWAAHTNLGNLLKARGRPEKAIEHHLKAIELQPNELLGYLNLGESYARLGDTQRAIETYQLGLRRLAEMPADRSKLETNIGSVCFTLGDLDGALEHFRKAIASDPSNAHAHCNLGLALARQGQRALAIEELRVAQRLSQGDSEIRDLLRRITSPHEADDGSR
jgi:tetratricopeptide (TPR) repeat protein